jgi:hypothetical protein
MTAAHRKSRVGFVVIKLSVGDAVYYLMRANSKWKDINFIGGHDKRRDGGDLKNTARRELWEEVPSLRRYPILVLEPLSSVIQYGPVLSRSKGDQVEYEVQFFLLKIDRSPAMLVELLSSRTRNVWVPEEELMAPNRYRLSNLVQLLNQIVPGGVRNIPFSSATNMSGWRSYFEPKDDAQLRFALK